MGNVLEKSKQEQVIALGRLGWSLRRIEEATGVRRETAGGYLRLAGIALRTPGGWGHGSPAKPAIEVTTGFLPSGTPPAQDGKGTVGASEPYREMIELELSRGRNAMGIFQDLVDTHGFTGGYQSVKRFVRKLRGAVSLEARVIIETRLGEECQVDYGTGPMVRDPDTGKYRRTRLFVLTLGSSRKCVRLLAFRSSARVWAELHEQAFRRLGGSTRVVVLDNLREGVLSADIYDPGLNPLYRDVLAHYGVMALPCKVRDPDRKGKVESSVGHAQKTPLKGKKFESLEEAQAYLDHWEEHWADKRIHGRTKRQVAAMFAEEKPFLQALPLEPFRYYQYGERTVHLDGCVEVEAAYYGAPPGWIGRQVNVQWDAMYVRLLDRRTGELLREHLSGKRGGHRIRDADRRAAHHHSCFNCWRVPTRPDPISALSATPSMLAKVNSECVASRAFSNWSSNMAAMTNKIWRVPVILSSDLTVNSLLAATLPSLTAALQPSWGLATTESFACSAPSADVRLAMSGGHGKYSRMGIP
jgi:transposase